MISRPASALATDARYEPSTTLRRISGGSRGAASAGRAGPSAARAAASRPALPASRRLQAPAASTTAPALDQRAVREPERPAPARRRRRSLPTSHPVRTTAPAARASRTSARVIAPRRALQVVGEPRRAEDRPGRAAARARGRAAGSISPHRSPRASRRATRAGSPSHVLASGWTISAPLRRMRASSPEPPLDLVVHRERRARVSSSSGPSSLSEASTLPSPSPVVPLDDLAAVDERHPDAAHRQLARARRPDDPGADDDDVRGGGVRAHSAKPAGNGSSASSRYWPIPVIQARPVISGTTAGPPADLGLLHEAAGEARPDHRLVDERRADREARRGRGAAPSAPTSRCRTASGRASRGGSTSPRARRRRRARARGRPRGGSLRCGRRRGAPGGRRR